MSACEVEVHGEINALKFKWDLYVDVKAAKTTNVHSTFDSEKMSVVNAHYV